MKNFYLVMAHNSLLVFDIETIPDVDVCSNLFGKKFDSVDDARKALTDYHLEITNGNNPFIRQLMHKVVCISYLYAEIERIDSYKERFVIKKLETEGEVNSSERDIVKGFLDRICKVRPRLVTFNGRMFDMPVIKYRAMIHKIQSEFLYKSGDKWNNYMQRYSVDWHCDLCEVLSDFGASAKVKLNEVCSVFGLPGKIGVSGADVTSLYDEGKIESIRDYCECDVLNTYLVYLRMMNHQGKIASYDESAEQIKSSLKKSKKNHILEFYKNWEEAESNYKLGNNHSLLDLI